MTVETILEPDLPIIDPHHHLWDHPAMARDSSGPVEHGFEHALRITPRYLLDELMRDLSGGHNVRATVFVECHSMYRADGPDDMKPVGETEFVNGVAAMAASGLYGPARPCAGIVGHVDFGATGSGATAALEAHIAAGGDRFRGVRQHGGYDADASVLGPLGGAAPGFYASSRFREGFATLAPLGLSFDAWVVEPQIPEVIDLARAFPDTEIVLDHTGTPLGMASYRGKRPERFGVWADNIRELAKSPNVTLKLGGLAMVWPGFDCYMADPPQTSQQMAADWQPYIETCIEAFGAERCMFESNFPVDRCGATYPVLWNAFKRLAKGYSASEKTALFSGTATRFYKLKL